MQLRNYINQAYLASMLPITCLTTNLKFLCFLFLFIPYCIQFRVLSTMAEGKFRALTPEEIEKQKEQMKKDGREEEHLTLALAPILQPGAHVMFPTYFAGNTAVHFRGLGNPPPSPPPHFLLIYHGFESCSMLEREHDISVEKITQLE